MEKKYFGIPIDETALGKNDGCKEAPNFLFDLFKVKGEIFSLKGEIEDKHQQIYEKAKEIFKEVGTSTPVFFGGTHDITGFVFKVFAEKNENAKLLIFDAHADCEDALSITTHEDLVRMIVEKNIVKVENILIVGLRHLSGIEKDFLKENKIKHFYFEEMDSSFETFLKVIEAFCDTKELYVSFDVDVIHSELMKATGHFPDNGFTRGQIRELLSITLPGAKAIDLVEFNPQKIVLNEDKLLFDLFNKYFK
ncbi:MAG: hypothetical protein HON47_05070 [Candidatus Diapherotrites archaeon]|uniref:Arginase family protein n=1 Tax=Candidatus Iainarchaeum sp. TaxID=3101447 RepID=A0A8T5GGH7_9ARCH|nr:hypothetical protein [Candidatus Diapherotrites archaeon]